MNFIYFLETGVNLEDTVRKRSKRRFFKFANASPRWKWLADYENDLNEFDDHLRTPEFHKMSALRKRLMNNQGHDSHEILTINNIANNVMWHNILSIITGNEASASYSETP